jgi:hypothetical protein
VNSEGLLISDARPQVMMFVSRRGQIRNTGFKTAGGSTGLLPYGRNRHQWVHDLQTPSRPFPQSTPAGERPVV